MYLLDLADGTIEAFKEGWGEIGDSIVVVGGEGLWNCHVHTNDIGAAVEVAFDLGGRPRQIRVTDLFEEMGEEHAVREAGMQRAEMRTDGPPATRCSRRSRVRSSPWPAVAAWSSCSASSACRA